MKYLTSGSLLGVIFLFVFRPLWGQVPFEGWLLGAEASSHEGVFLNAAQGRANAWFPKSMIRRGGNVHFARRLFDLPYFFPMYYAVGGTYRTVRKYYLSSYFVDQWKDQDPARQMIEHDLEQSVLLSKGMDQAAVIGKLGSPVHRMRLGNREIWRYSSYSLLFESGALVRIQ